MSVAPRYEHVSMEIVGARGELRCASCKAAIADGERFAVASWTGEAGVLSEHTCLRCVVMWLKAMAP